MSFTVAIVGRPNVGKSTFFNRLLEQRKAIVDDTSGVTRDRQYGVADWNGKSFNVIDTGGFVPQSEDVFEREIKKQVLIAVEEASAILFIVDATTGITDLDEAMADVLRRSTKPVFLVVNKVDNNDRLLEGAEFYSLGFENIFFIAAISGSGDTGSLTPLSLLVVDIVALWFIYRIARGWLALRDGNHVIDHFQHDRRRQLVGSGAARRRPEGRAPRRPPGRRRNRLRATGTARAGRCGSSACGRCRACRAGSPAVRSESWLGDRIGSCAAAVPRIGNGVWKAHGSVATGRCSRLY